MATFIGNMVFPTFSDEAECFRTEAQTWDKRDNPKDVLDGCHLCMCSVFFLQLLGLSLLVGASEECIVEANSEFYLY